jgi:hypothetical protein
MPEKYLNYRVIIYFFCCSQVIELLFNVTLFNNFSKQDFNSIQFFESNFTSQNKTSGFWIEKNKFFKIKDAHIVFLSLTSNFFPEFLIFNNKLIQVQNQPIKTIKFFNETSFILLYKNFIIYEYYFVFFEKLFFLTNFIIVKFISIVFFLFYIVFENHFNCIYYESLLVNLFLFFYNTFEKITFIIKYGFFGLCKYSSRSDKEGKEYDYEVFRLILIFILTFILVFVNSLIVNSYILHNWLKHHYTTYNDHTTHNNNQPDLPPSYKEIISLNNSNDDKLPAYSEFIKTQHLTLIESLV